MSENDGFLSRWSQRKRLAAEEARKAAEAASAAAPAEAPEAETEPLDLSLLPDLDTLTAETDIRLFLQKGVPDELRNLALRKMWALDPAIRDYVGDALDYAWDWNAPGGVPGGGELGAGFDTAKMVAQIFGDEVSDKNVKEGAATQQGASEALVSAPERLESDPSRTLVAGESPVASDPSSMAKPEAVSGSPPAAPQKKRRHGGAAPTLLDKSLVL